MSRLLLPLLAPLLFALTVEQGATAQELIRRIAIGSCADQSKPQPIWGAIVEAKPQLFLFLGDNIYGDTTDMDVLRKKYAQLDAQPGFQKLRKSTRLLATWDDHDYGANDAGREYSKKAESQQVFLDFLGVPKNSPRRERPGVYDSYTFGPEGKRVQVILLDTRYFRSRLKRWPQGRPAGKGPYVPNDDRRAIMLGEAQWAWLYHELKKPADVRIIASSIQFVAADHHWESWAKFPDERKKMLRIIGETGANGVIFVSGDRHHGEISKLEPNETASDYPIYDLTSSSLNRPGSNQRKDENQHRIGDLYSGINFGTIDIDWSTPDPIIRLAIHDGAGKVVRETQVRLGKLTAPRPINRVPEPIERERRILDRED